MAEVIHVRGVVAAGFGLGGAPEALPVRAVQTPAEHAGEPADLAEPGFLAAFCHEFIAFPQGKGILQPVQGRVHAGRRIAAFDGVEGDRPDVPALDRPGGGLGGLK